MMLGITVLLLVIVRIAIRTQNPAPPIVPAPPAWQNAIAHLTHLTLYAAMIAMPLLGWLMTSAGGHAVPFYGLSLPPLLGENKPLPNISKKCTSSSATRSITSSASTPLPRWRTTIRSATTHSHGCCRCAAALRRIRY